MSAHHSPSHSLTPNTARVASLRSQNSRTSSSSPTRNGTRQSITPSPRPSQSSNATPIKQASYTETALQINSSPPLTSFLNDRHSASSAQEEAYLKTSFRHRVIRLVLSVLTIATALAAMGVEGHILKFYNDTRLGSEWHLPLWPINIDIKPTLGVLIPAALVAVAHLAYIAAALIPSPHSRTSLLTKLFLLTTLLGTVVSFFSILFSPILTHHIDPPHRDTIHSFTCRLYRGAADFNRDSADMGIPMFGEAMRWPIGFKRMCVETEVGVGLIAGVFGLCVLGLGVAAWGMAAERKIERGRRERWEGKWSENDEGKA